MGLDRSFPWNRLVNRDWMASRHRWKESWKAFKTFHWSLEGSNNFWSFVHQFPLFKMKSCSPAQEFSSGIYLSLLGKGRAYEIKAIMGVLQLAAFYAALLARELPLEMPMTSIWCPLLWSTATSRGRFTTSSSLRFSGPCLMGGISCSQKSQIFPYSSMGM